MQIQLNVFGVLFQLWDAFHETTHQVWYNSPDNQTNPFVRKQSYNIMLTIIAEPK